MKIGSIFALFVAVLLGTMSGSALAHGYGGHARIGFYSGPVWYPPVYYYVPPPVYYAPAYPQVPYTPPAYVQQQSVPVSANWWHYCADSKAYYPYVKECPGGWQRVRPQPPQ